MILKIICSVLRMIFGVIIDKVKPAEVRLPYYNTLPILQEIKHFFESSGSIFAIAFQGIPDGEHSEFFENKFNFINLDVPTNLTYPGRGFHRTPEGHSFVAEKLFHFLVTNQLIK